MLAAARRWRRFDVGGGSTLATSDDDRYLTIVMPNHELDEPRPANQSQECLGQNGVGHVGIFSRDTGVPELVSLPLRPRR